MSRVNKPPQVNLSLQGVGRSNFQAATSSPTQSRGRFVDDDYYPEGVDRDEFDAMVSGKYLYYNLLLQEILTTN